MAAMGSLEEVVRATEQEMCTIWSTIGYTEAEIRTKTDAIWAAIKGILNDSIEAGKMELAERTDALDLLNSNIAIITEELTGTTPSPQVTVGSLGIIQRQRAASKKLAGLEKERNQRLQSLQAKQEELNGLNVHLGKPEIDVEKDTEGIDLTRARLEKMDGEIQVASQSNDELSTATIQLMTQTQQLEAELGIEFAFRTPGDLPLHERHSRFEAHLFELRATKKARLDELDASRAEIARLSDRLKISANDQAEYFAQFSGRDLHKPVLATFTDRIAELKKQLKDNFHSMVSDLRSTIVDLWGVLGHAEEEQATFMNDPLGMAASAAAAVDSGEAAMDQVLNRHEAEVVELKRQHAELKPILSLIKKREDAQARLAELASPNVCDKDANRGGRMLKLQKERKSLEKAVKLCENKLIRLIPSWEGNMGKPFMYEGERLLRSLQPKSSGLAKMSRPSATPSRSKDTAGASKTPAKKAAVTKPSAGRSVDASRARAADQSAALRTPRHKAAGSSSTSSSSRKATATATKTPRRRDPTATATAAKKVRSKTRAKAKVAAAVTAAPAPVAAAAIPVPSAAVIEPSITPKAANITRGRRSRAPAAKKTPGSQFIYRTKKTAFGDAANRPALVSAGSKLATPVGNTGLGKRTAGDTENSCVTPLKGKRQRIR